MRERKESVTVKATSWELERWGNAAYTAGRRTLPAFLIFAADLTACALCASATVAVAR